MWNWSLDEAPKDGATKVDLWVVWPEKNEARRSTDCIFKDGAWTFSQVAEIIGLLGRRWRGLTDSQIRAEVKAIVERAGVQSAHGI